MQKYITRALLGALVLSGACKEGLSAPSQDALVAGSSQPVQNLVTGILATDRSQASAFSYLLYGETMARNSARIDPNEPRFINELIAVPIDNSDFIGTSGWTGGFQTVRASNQLLTGTTLSATAAGDQAAIRGLVQTIKALDYIRIMQLRDSLGAPIQSNDPAAIDPFRTKGAVLAYMAAVLDSGYANLTAAGVDATVPVTLPSGYTSSGDYTTTANLALFNRGLAGEVAVMRGFDHQTPCSSCFATADHGVERGAHAVRRDADRRAARAGTVLRVQPERAGVVLESARGQPHLPDRRTSSTRSRRATPLVEDRHGGRGVGDGERTSAHDPRSGHRSVEHVQPDQTDPDPAQRRICTSSARRQKAETGDLAGAAADVNAVRVGEGGLAPVGTFASVDAARQAILYEMRYSLIYEGPFYLVALREYALLTRHTSRRRACRRWRPTPATRPIR